MALNVAPVRDTKWLTLEVCRQYQRGTCSRSDEECKFAHPPKSCQVENGRVIACFDSLKVRWSFYMSPPACVGLSRRALHWALQGLPFRSVLSSLWWLLGGLCCLLVWFSLKLIYTRHTKIFFSISVFKLKIHGGVFLVWFDIQVPKSFKSKSGLWQRQ